jgi:uncharacterized protein YjcR
MKNPASKQEMTALSGWTGNDRIAGSIKKDPEREEAAVSYGDQEHRGHRERSGNEHSPAMPNGRCRMHGGLSPGAPKGNRNAFKHGRYTAEAIAGRRQIAELVRAMKALARNH